MFDRLKPSREFLTDVLHLLVLCSFAVAQPLFDLLGKNPTFFVARRSRPFDILFLTLSLSVFVPLFLAFLEWLARLANRRVQQTIHALMVATLAALIALPALKKVGESHPEMLVACAVLLGSFVGVGCVRLPIVRSFLTILSPAIGLFPLLFLLHTPVRRIVFPQFEATGRGLAVKATAPVVVVVFDELNSVSLMDERHDIDPLRYPNFAAFAKESTWFRNATTVSSGTEKALTAILTGLRPDPNLLPTAQDYPRNLFTLLHGSYGMRVVEPITHLCPETVCRETAPLPPAAVRLRSMFLDLSAVYLHVVLPNAFARRLPVVTQSWGDFWQEGQGRGQGTVEGKDAAARMWSTPPEQFEGFLKSISGTERPTLYFLHVALPHVPYQFLPSGKRYTDPRLDIPGLDSGTEQWGADNWLAIQGYQRYLLQVGFVDKLLGVLVARLKALGLYEGSLVVITADHGVSFRAGGNRRLVLRENYQDIMPVPLFVKAPGQQGGRIDDRNVESIDILPTIAHILGIEPPWPLDGTSAWNPSVPERQEKRICNPQSPEKIFKFDAAFPDKYRALQDKLALFGAGTRPDGLFKIGSFRDLVGKRITEVGVAGNTAVMVGQDQASSLFKDFTPGSDFVPALISGNVREPGSASPPRVSLAIVVNGTIQAVTETFDKNEHSPTPGLSRGFGVAGFDAMVPETAFQAGNNKVQIYVVSRAADGRTRLALARSGLLGQKIQMFKVARYRTLGGSLDSVEFPDGGTRSDADPLLINVSGWAGFKDVGIVPDEVLVAVNDEIVAVTSPRMDRPDVMKAYQDMRLLPSGWVASFFSRNLRVGENRVVAYVVIDAATKRLALLSPRIGIIHKTQSKVEVAYTLLTEVETKALPVARTAPSHLTSGRRETAANPSSLVGESIGGFDVRRFFPSVLRGSIERLSVSHLEIPAAEQTISVSGWAAVAGLDTPPDWIAVAVNNTIVAVTSPCCDRPDVAEASKDPHFLRSGWQASFSSRKLKEGENLVTAYIVLDAANRKLAALSAIQNKIQVILK